jgi:anti-anti-sigma factor
VQLAGLQLRRSGRVLVATVAGEIDMSNARDLSTAITSELTNDALGLVIDLAAVDYLDSAAIHTIYELHQRLVNRGQVLRLVVPPEAPTRDALVLAGVPEAVGTAPTADAAARAIAPGEA